MATSKVIYQSNLRTDSTHIRSGVNVISDAPLDNQGKGAAFSPTDYCATSLAMCMLTIAGIFTQNKDYVIDGSFAEVQKIMASEPRRISEIIVNITFKCSRPLNEKEKLVLQRAAETCPVTKSLHPDIKQQFHYLYE